MHSLMATGAPAGAPPQPTRRAVVGTANDNPGWRLLLEVAAEAEIGVARNQHLLVNRSMRVVTGRASFAHRLVLEDKRPALSGVALTAGVVLGEQGGSTAPHRRALVRVVTIAATHLPAQHRVTVGQLKLPFLVQMTLEAGVW